MSSSALFLRWVNFTRIPLVTPGLLELGARGIAALPTLILLTHSFYYYSDFLRAQTPQFYNTEHYDLYDFIVVGGGSAGAVLANRLSRHSSVILLELGGDPTPIALIPSSAGILQRCPSTDLMYETVPQNHSSKGLKNGVMFWPRGTGIGGSSNLNFMIYQRGNPKDYDNWARITENEEWSYKSVLKTFKKLEDYHGAYPSEKFHGRGGPLHVEKSRQTYMAQYFLKAAAEAGFPVHDTNAEQGEGFGEMDVTNNNGVRWSTFPAYIEPILNRKNLHISRYSRVVKIHLDKHRHSYGVTYHRHGITKFVRARREVIVSAGAVDTPKLLMLSSIGPISHLHSVGLKCRVNLPVGQNLQDHLVTLVGPFLFDENVTESLHPIRDVNLESVLKYASNRTGPLASISTISAVGFYNTLKTKEAKLENWPDIQYFQLAFGIPRGLGRVLEHIANAHPALAEKYVEDFYGRHANTIIQVLVRPKSIGEIKLAGKDPLLKPIIQPNYFARREDLVAMVEGMKFMVNLYENTTTYQKLGAQLIPRPLRPCRHFKLKSEAYYACYARTLTQTLYHPVGTAAMGADDFYTKKGQKQARKGRHGPMPVVDSQLRVFKTHGLRVVDASVMPVIVNSNTNVPSIMIGERGSELIRRYWTEQSQVSPYDFRLLTKSQANRAQCTYARIY